MKVSVCIATWCRAPKLKEIIISLEHQTMNSNDYEIIVADSFSTDGTGELIKQLQVEYSNITYIEDADNVLANKRNRAFAVAKGDVIITIDDDVVPDKYFVESHYNANVNNTDTFFCGQIRFRPELIRNSNYFRFRDAQHLSKNDEGKDLKYNKIVVMNLSFRKEFLEVVGNFNENFIGYGCEDIEYGYRIEKSGYKIKYLPEAFAYHDESSSDIKQYGNKLYKSGLYGKRVLKKECPECGRNNNRKNKVLFPLSIRFVNRFIEKILVFTDNKQIFYSYKLFKAYLIGKKLMGEKDQNKVPLLKKECVKNGW